MRFGERSSHADFEHRPSRINRHSRRLAGHRLPVVAGRGWRTIRDRRPGRGDRLRWPFLRKGCPHRPVVARPTYSECLPAADRHSPHRQERTLSARPAARYIRAPGTHLQLSHLGAGHHRARSSTPHRAQDRQIRPAAPPAGSTRIGFRLTLFTTRSPPPAEAAHHDGLTGDDNDTRGGVARPGPGAACLRLPPLLKQTRSARLFVTGSGKGGRRQSLGSPIAHEAASETDSVGRAACPSVCALIRAGTR
jgi:hypothetical protein